MRERKLLITDQKVYAVIIIILILLQAYSIFNISSVAIEQRVIILSFVGAIIMLFANYKVIGSTWNFLVLLECGGSLFITCVLHTGLGSAIMAFNLIIFAMIFNNICISGALYKIMHSLCAVVLTYYLFTIDMRTANSTTVIDKFGNSLNTNVVALWALAALLHWASFLFAQEIKKWIKGVLFVIIYAFAGYYIVMCASRTALIAVIIFGILCIFIQKPISNTTYRNLSIIILILSLLFPLIYVGLIGKVANFKLLGKYFFSGRQNVWNDVFEAIKKYPLFGSGNDIMMHSVAGTYTSSAHNMLLGMWKMFGIIPTLTTIFILVNNNNNDAFGDRNRIAQFAFLSSLSCCFFESFYTYSHLYFFFILFLISFVKTYDEEQMDAYIEDEFDNKR